MTKIKPVVKTLTFQPKKLTKELLNPLNTRAKDVIQNRFGLLENGESKTLESIGRKYGITRERVRQIENFALGLIKKSEEYATAAENFLEIRDVLNEEGAIVLAEEFFPLFGKDKSVQNHIKFYMVLDDNTFTHHKDDDKFNERWSTHTATANTVQTSLSKLHSNIGDEEMLAETVLLDRFLKQVDDLHEMYKDEKFLKKYLKLSKDLGQNQMGHWGKKSSPNIKTRGIKDYAYLIMKKEGKPMHFRDVSKEILTQFGRKAHTATTHNELIRDERFVLVGRGVYALREWGHMGGVVREVIAQIIENAKRAMKKEEIIEAVKKERIVKDNTILVNLQNPLYFKKNADGTYNVKKADK